MATATNSTLGQILLSGDLTGTGEMPILRATGVKGGTYNATIGVPSSTGVSSVNIPKLIVDSKGRIPFASNTAATLQWQVANSTTNGILKVDGTSITSASGVLTSTTGSPPIATASVNGIVKGGGGTPTGVFFLDPGDSNYPQCGVVTVTSSRRGAIRSDQTTIFCDANGIISAAQPKATSSTIGRVKPDNNTTFIDADGTIRAMSRLATSSDAGIVKPDASMAIDGNGTLSIVMGAPVATSSAKGTVKPDNTTVTINGSGTLSASIASVSVLGCVKPFTVNSGLTVDGSEALKLSFAPVYKVNYGTKTLTSAFIASNGAKKTITSASVISIGETDLSGNTLLIHLTDTGANATISGFWQPSLKNYIGAKIRLVITKNSGAAGLILGLSNTTDRKGKFYSTLGSQPGPTFGNGSVELISFTNTQFLSVELMVFDDDSGIPTCMVLNQRVSNL